MIRNLNQVNFSQFGALSSEHSMSVFPFPKELAATIDLSDKEAQIFAAISETWIVSNSGMCILSVLTPGEGYLHFYLDKPVRLSNGTRYALSAFMGNASALVYASSVPHALGVSPSEKLRLDSKLHVEGIYTFFYQEKEQGFLFPGESHPFPELTYVDKGELHSVVDGQDLLLKQGDLVIYGPGQWHMQFADIGIAPRFVTISFDLRNIDLSPLLNRKFTAPQQTLYLLQSMLKELDSMDLYSADVILSQLNLLLILLLRESINPSGSRIRNSNIAQNENEIIRRAQQYISAHIREKLSVPAVAEQVDVSPSYLTVLFHRNLQISPGEYIRRIKLQESKQMIRENNMNFTEIASSLHYSTVHHFSRQFKDKFGITPSEYAKSVR